MFVANATAGLKLVAECFREQDRGFWYGYHRDAHTSLVGVREYAAKYHCFEEDEDVELWLQSQRCPSSNPRGTRVGLFAYPAQSNLNGRRLPLSWSGCLRSCLLSDPRVYSLLDAAAFGSTFPLNLSEASQAPDFTVLSFYKIFGFPDIGALIVRKESSLPLSRRKYFGGGTVEMVTCTMDSWHIKKQNSLHEQLEDGTLPIHSIIALGSAFEVHEKLFFSLECISSHTSFLAKELYQKISSLRHANGLPVCVIYKDSNSSYEDSRTQGPTVALNLRNSRGEWISNAEVEKLATIRNIHLRTGGLCNPGGVASFLDLAPWEMKRNFSAGQRCGNEDDILSGKPTGVIRLSLGAMSNMHDITVFVHFIEEFFVEHQHSPEATRVIDGTHPDFYIEALTIFPIKSCGGWQIPSSQAWEVKPEGLAWDREWCLVHEGTRAALSQKRFPRMALFRPSLDLESGLLRIRYDGPLPPSAHEEISVPLSANPSSFQDPSNLTRKTCSQSRVCGDSISASTYTSPSIAAFFTTTLSTPCTLARFPQGPSTRHSKLYRQRPNRRSTSTSSSLPSSTTSQPIPGAFPPTPPPSPPFYAHPIFLSNESPILAISRSSLNHLNALIPNTPAPASVFRANIVLAQMGPGPERPYDEDNWSGLRVQRVHAATNQRMGDNDDEDDGDKVIAELDVLGPCRRCQMICVDQTTAERRDEPFVTLAKTRRKEGEGSKVFFGVHCALAPRDGDGDCRGVTVQVGDKVIPLGDDEEN